MIMPAPTFIELCLNGEALASEIDDYVEQWHDGTDQRSLPEYLGLTENEYALWVEQPHLLKLIIFSRKNGTSIDQVLAQFQKGHAMAARASSPQEVDELVSWLKKTKRIPS